MSLYGLAPSARVPLKHSADFPEKDQRPNWLDGDGAQVARPFECWIETQNERLVYANSSKIIQPESTSIRSNHSLYSPWFSEHRAQNRRSAGLATNRARPRSGPRGRHASQ